jgi:hypothetical protein
MTQLWSNNYNRSNKTSNFYVFIGSNGRIRIKDLVDNYNISSILDYGCGYSNSVQNSFNLFNITNVELAKYDPFVPEYSSHPNTTFDLVICHNVLQWVEREFMNDVVQDIANTSNKLVLINNIITSNTDSSILKYTTALQNANLNIIDYKIHNSDDKIAVLEGKIDDDLKTIFKNENTINFTILASKI